MNLKKIILDEVKNKNWNEFTIARYIYIRLCELFVYDTLYHYGSNDMKEEILAKKIDIENVDTRKIICKSWSYMYSDLLKEMGITSYVLGENHTYVVIKIEEKEIIADPTSGSYADLARVKYGDETIGFDVQTEDGKKKIGKVDEIISYKKVIYLSEVIEMLREEFNDLKKVNEELNIDDNMNLIEITRIKFEFLCFLLNSMKTIDKGFSDSVSFLHHLMELLLHTMEYFSIESVNYYKIDENNLEIENVALFKIVFEEYKYYYLLSNKEDGYSIEKISEELVSFYDSNFCSKRKMLHI